MTYIGGGYYPVNRILREGGMAATCILPLSNALVHAISHYPVYAGKVYRGTGALPKRVLDTYKPGSTETEKGFTSTSKNEQIAFGQFFDPAAGWKFRIRTTSCRDISSINESEQEVLCAPNSKFLVTQRNDETRTIWMTQIP